PVEGVRARPERDRPRADGLLSRIRRQLLGGGALTGDERLERDAGTPPEHEPKLRAVAAGRDPERRERGAVPEERPLRGEPDPREQRLPQGAAGRRREQRP